MPSVGRKFLLAGKGGLNLTHCEAVRAPSSRATARAAPRSSRCCATSAPTQLREWAARPGHRDLRRQLGPRVPDRHEGRAAAARLAAPAARRRACASTCATAGWAGDAGRRACASPRRDGERTRARRRHRAGAGRRELAAAGLRRRLGAAGCASAASTSRRCSRRNCGFDVGWSAHFAQRFAGAAAEDGVAHRRVGRRCAPGGEFVVTDSGVEGSLVYAASALLRDAIARAGPARRSQLDLLPGAQRRNGSRAEVAHPRGPRSLSTHLKTPARPRRREGRRCCASCCRARRMADPARLAAAIKALPLALTRGAADRRGDQQRRRRALRGARRRG